MDGDNLPLLASGRSDVLQLRLRLTRLDSTLFRFDSVSILGLLLATVRCYE